MKSIQLIFLFILSFQTIRPQTANQYVPVEIGNVWLSNFYILDSTGNPIGQPQIYVDSSIAYQNFLGKQTLFIIRKPAGAEIGDTNWIAPSGQSIFIHQRNIEFDTIISFTLPNWFEYYRFGTSLGSFYTIYQFDTTLNVPQLGTLPLRFLLRGARLGLDTVTVPAGFFNAVKFRIELKVQYLVSLPPPLPPFTIDIVTIPMNDWLAQGRYIVKSLQEPFAIDTLGVSIPGSLRELVEFRSATLVEDDLNPQKFLLRQNYPNPFNGKTFISFSLMERSFVSLNVYDCLGRKITELVNKELNQGEHLFEFEAEQFKLKSGVYFYTILTGGKRQTRSMIYLK